MESLQRPTTASLHDGKAESFADVAVDMVHAAEDEFTDEQYKKVLRKVDWILLPMMWVCKEPRIVTSLRLLGS